MRLGMTLDSHSNYGGVTPCPKRTEATAPQEAPPCCLPC